MYARRVTARTDTRSAGMQPEMSYAVSICHTLVAWYLKLLVAVILLNLVLSVLDKNLRLRYYGCYISYVMTASVLSILYLPGMMLRFRHPNNVMTGNHIAMILSRVIGIRWELRGTQHIAKDEAAIVTLSHQSILDMFGFMAMGPIIQKAWAVARNEVFYYWPFGLLLWFSGVIFIDRKNGRTSNKKLLRSVEDVKKNKVKLLIFPEGTRNKKAETLLPFKKGAFRMAIEGQLPIIPIVYSPYYFINSQKKTFHQGKIIMSVLSPISTKGKTLADLDEVVEKTRTIMEEEFQKLRKEVEIKYGPFKT